MDEPRVLYECKGCSCKCQALIPEVCEFNPNRCLDTAITKDLGEPSKWKKEPAPSSALTWKSLEEIFEAYTPKYHLSSTRDFDTWYKRLKDAILAHSAPAYNLSKERLVEIMRPYKNIFVQGVDLSDFLDAILHSLGQGGKECQQKEKLPKLRSDEISGYNIHELGVKINEIIDYINGTGIQGKKEVAHSALPKVSPESKKEMRFGDICKYCGREASLHSCPKCSGTGSIPKEAQKGMGKCKHEYKIEVAEESPTGVIKRCKKCGETIV